VITVFKKGTTVAASKGSFRTGKLLAIQSLEDWCIWASIQTGLDTAGTQARAVDRSSESGPDRGDPIHEAFMKAQAGISGGTGNPRETARHTAGQRRRADTIRTLKERLDSIRLTTDRVVPLDLACASSREALFGPAGAAYTHRGIVAQMARSRNVVPWELHSWPRMGECRHVVWQSLASPPIRPELTGIALASKSALSRRISPSSLIAYLRWTCCRVCRGGTFPSRSTAIACGTCCCT
jgi:hypothetical protein